MRRADLGLVDRGLDDLPAKARLMVAEAHQQERLVREIAS